MKSRNIKESVVESFLVQSVRTLGGLCFKLTFIGTMGAPDRLVLMPGGRFYFIELKQTTGKLEASQAILFPRIEKRGFKVHVLYGTEQVQQFIDNILKDPS
jgi:hypothetical protein